MEGRFGRIKRVLNKGRRRKKKELLGSIVFERIIREELLDLKGEWEEA